MPAAAPSAQFGVDGVSVPDATGSSAQLEACDGAGATAGLHGHPEGAVEGAVRSEGGGALADLVAELPKESQAQRRGRHGDREAAGAHRRLAAGIRDRHVPRAQRRRGRDGEGDRELSGGDDRGRADGDVGAEGGARAGLEVGAGHGHGGAGAGRAGAGRHAGDRRHDRQGHRRAGRRPVCEVGGDRKAGAAPERRRVEVGREHEERRAVGDCEAHGPVPGVEQRAVQTRRRAQGPVRRRGVGVPGATAGRDGAARAVSRCGRHCRAARSPGRCHRGAPSGAEGRGALPHLVAQLAEERQADRCRRQSDREAAGADRGLAAGSRPSRPAGPAQPWGRWRGRPRAEWRRRPSSS